MKYLRLCGIYSQDILQVARSSDVSAFAFDMRPKSFNFIPVHRLQAMLLDSSECLEQYSFQFENEKDFVVKGLLEKLSIESPQLLSNISLEFSDKMPRSYYEQFNRPFIWHYTSGHDYRSILESGLCQTLVVSNKELELSYRQGQIYDLLNHLCALKEATQTKLEIRCHWGEDLLSSILDFFPIDGLSYFISSEIEYSYRNVNLQIVKEQLELTKRIFY